MPAQYVTIRQPRREKDKRVRLFGDVYMYKLEVEWRGIFTSSDEEPLEGYMVRGIREGDGEKVTFVFDRSKFGNIINRFEMQRFIMSMVRNIN